MSVNKRTHDFNKNRKNYNEYPSDKTIQFLDKLVDDIIKEEKKGKKKDDSKR